ncbi:hypothetical protein F511_16767 [Dorcoceras hygrometricum]|uniref:Uncharacterized protein n=1 Tax=Dorcoceras hygrometricum TaxID=472368 RepID=A0A2Z7B8J3_9LAMI|nr:hypothetical protein F511_16767 [Dorcoceras hygrometricum]
MASSFYSNSQHVDFDSVLAMDDQGESSEFPASKILTAKTVHRYISINDKVGGEETADAPPVKKAPKKPAVSKKRPAEEKVLKKKRTLNKRSVTSHSGSAVRSYGCVQLLTSVHFATTSFSNTIACDWFCLRLVTVACDWLLLLVTGFSCDWSTGHCCLRLVLLTTGFAYDWLLLLATGYYCFRWYFLRLVLLVIERFLASEFHQRLVRVSLAISLYQRLLLRVACFNTFESFSLKLAPNLE